MRFLHDHQALELRDGAREFLRDRFSAEILREMMEGGGSAWDELAEIGLTGALVTEGHGGLDMGAGGFALLAEEAGYVALPDPLVEVAGVAVAMLNAAGGDAPEAALAGIADGSTRVRVVHPDHPWVNRAEDGDSVLHCSGDGVVLLGPGDYALEAMPDASIDPLRHLSRVEKTGDGVPLDGAELSALARRHGAVFGAAELLGLAQAMIDRSTVYAAERKQFGKAIGTQQALKHHLASAFVALEFARPAVYRAAASDLNSACSKVAVAQARIAAVEAATGAAETAIQVHGAMGYTFEADLHLWMKRCWALAGQWGDLHHHLGVLDDVLFKGDLDMGPGTTFNFARNTENA